jgi:hypothetical protein
MQRPSSVVITGVLSPTGEFAADGKADLAGELMTWI